MIYQYVHNWALVRRHIMKSVKGLGVRYIWQHKTYLIVSVCQFSILYANSQIYAKYLWGRHKGDMPWLIPRGLEMPYGDIDLVQHWLSLWLVAFRHYVITWINSVFLSSMGYSGYHLRPLSQGELRKSTRKMGLKNTLVELPPCL